MIDRSSHRAFQTDSHKVFVAKNKFFNKPWDLLRLNRYKFEYRVPVKSLSYWNDQLFDGKDLCLGLIELQGKPVQPWVAAQSRGKISTTCYFQRAWAEEFLYNIGKPLNEHIQFKIGFSDQSLATLWKLSWGGKMVDG